MLETGIEGVSSLCNSEALPCFLMSVWLALHGSPITSKAGDTTWSLILSCELQARSFAACCTFQIVIDMMVNSTSSPVLWALSTFELPLAIVFV